jgi:Spy/CpxP family protein refolding chaperone
MTSLSLIKQKKLSVSVRIIPAISIFISVFVFDCNSQGSSPPEPVTIFICASQETGFQGEIFIPLQFLQHKETIDGLKLTDAQKGRINELINTTDSVVFKTYAKPGFHPTDFDEIRRQLDEARRVVMEILRPDQMARLKGNLFLRYGLRSLTKRDMRDLLHVTKMQTVKIDEIRARMLSKIYDSSEILEKGSSDESCRMIVVNDSKTEKILADAELSVLNILTPEQREALNQLKEQSIKTSTR